MLNAQIRTLTFFNSRIIFSLNLHRSQFDSLSKTDVWLSGILKVHKDDELTDKFIDINTKFAIGTF